MRKVKTFITANYKLMGVALFASLAGVLIGGTLVSQAAIPASDGTIHGCRNNTTTMLRVIDNASQSCDSNESNLNWDQKGVKAYARITQSGSTYSLDSNRTYNISNLQKVSMPGPAIGSAILCMTSAGEPKNLSITPVGQASSTDLYSNTNLTHIGLKDANGWTSSSGTTCDQLGTGANILVYVGGSSGDFFLTVH